MDGETLEEGDLEADGDKDFDAEEDGDELWLIDGELDGEDEMWSSR